MQGWTPDFIPKITGDAVDAKLIGKLLTIPGPDAMKCSQQLARKEGIFVGITAGATFAGALQIAAEAPKGANILCMLPDTGERYLSTPLFADIPAEMTEEEIAIAKSTPYGQAATAVARAAGLGRELARRPRTPGPHEGVEFLGRQRRRVVVALPDRAGAAQQEVGLLLGFDALGDRFEPERFGHGEDHLDDGGRVRIDSRARG